MRNMNGVVSSSMGALLLCAILVFDLALNVSGNAEGDALNAFKTSVADPNNVLQSWNATLVNPCTWFHVTCDIDESVTRVDLQNANLSGELVSELGLLPNLQYLELHSNNITGKIPAEFVNLTNSVSLDLYGNRISGSIPETLGKLRKLRFLYMEDVQMSSGFPEIHSHNLHQCLHAIYILDELMKTNV